MHIGNNRFSKLTFLTDLVFAAVLPLIFKSCCLVVSSLYAQN